MCSALLRVSHTLQFRGSIFQTSKVNEPLRKKQIIVESYLEQFRKSASQIKGLHMKTDKRELELMISVPAQS